jgi:cobalamin biosynthesis Mg chelatase CobN
MKFTYIIFIIVLVFYLFLACSCKTRQMAKVAVHTSRDSSHVSSHDSSSSGLVHVRDTSSRNTHIVTTNKDSSVTTTDFIPDSGSKVTIGIDGSISGTFKHIRQSTTTHKNRTKEETRQQNSGKDSTSVQNLQVHNKDSTQLKTVKDSTNKQVKSDSTIAANFPWWYVVLVVGILGVIFFLLKKFKII